MTTLTHDTGAMWLNKNFSWAYDRWLLPRNWLETVSMPTNPCKLLICQCSSTPSFAKFSLISRYFSKFLGTTHVPVQEFALQVFCRHLYQYICYCQYFSLVPLDPRELCERGCTSMKGLLIISTSIYELYRHLSGLYETTRLRPLSPPSRYRIPYHYSGDGLQRVECGA